LTTPADEVVSQPADAIADDAALVAALRSGDEQAFLSLVERYHAALIRLAGEYVSSQAVAEEVVQDTWLAVLEGIDRFEARSSLKTWLFHILTNRAKTRGQRERRIISFTDLAAADVGRDEPSVDPSRFQPAGHLHPGGWSVAPRPWDAPEARLLGGEVRGLVFEAIATLSPTQRQVILMRDVEGWEPAEVCAVLGISRVNQRVLLHRARSRVRAALDGYLDVGQDALTIVR
jgi:RNA polymerase sigma-70 factor (ECF subfamily)